jgi:hypothetical protein
MKHKQKGGKYLVSPAKNDVLRASITQGIAFANRKSDQDGLSGILFEIAIPPTIVSELLPGGTKKEITNLMVKVCFLSDRDIDLDVTKQNGQRTTMRALSQKNADHEVEIQNDIYISSLAAYKFPITIPVIDSFVLPVGSLDPSTCFGYKTVQPKTGSLTGYFVLAMPHAGTDALTFLDDLEEQSKGKGILPERLMILKKKMQQSCRLTVIKMEKLGWAHMDTHGYNFCVIPVDSKQEFISYIIDFGNTVRNSTADKDFATKILTKYESNKINPGFTEGETGQLKVFFSTTLNDRIIKKYNISRESLDGMYDFLMEDFVSGERFFPENGLPVLDIGDVRTCIGNSCALSKKPLYIPPKADVLGEDPVEWTREETASFRGRIAALNEKVDSLWKERESNQKKIEDLSKIALRLEKLEAKVFYKPPPPLQPPPPPRTSKRTFFWPFSGGKTLKKRRRRTKTLSKL